MEVSVESVKSNQIKSYIECFKENKSNERVLFDCLVKDCKSSYRDKSGAIRHIRVHHSDIRKEIEINKNKSGVDDELNKILELRVHVKINDILEACVDLITKNALPLCAVEYPAFKKILLPYKIALEKHGHHLSVNRENMKELIRNRANKIKEVIKLECEKKVVCLMVDIASRWNRSVLGINVAYVHNGETCIRTIGMHTLKVSHTAKNIRDVINQNLTVYGIKLSQIYAITTDNGKNLIKCIALLDEDYQNQKEPPIESTNNDELDDDDADDGEEEIEENIFDETYYSDLLSNVRSLFTNEVSYTDLIQGLSCAAHCMHLVVTKAIDKCQTVTTLINSCRSLAKALRKPTIRNKLETAKLNNAILDVETRWNSTYNMVFIIS